MSYTDTTFLALKKADKGSNQPFETDVFNANWNAIDAGVSTLDGRVDAIEANDWVTSARIAANAVGASEIASGAVGSDELAAGAVLTAKIGDSQVTSAKIDTVAGTKVTGTVPDATKWAGRAVFVSSTTPTGMATGDIWFKTA